MKRLQGIAIMIGLLLVGFVLAAAPRWAIMSLAQSVDKIKHVKHAPGIENCPWDKKEQAWSE